MRKPTAAAPLDENSVAPVSLDALVRMQSEPEEVIEEIDFSDLFNLPEKSCIYRFKEPDTAAIFALHRTADKIRTEPIFAHWCTELLQSVALFSLCYVPPATEKQLPHVLIAHLVHRTRNRPEIFGTMLQRLMQAFPHLSSYRDAVDEAKKNS